MAVKQNSETDIVLKVQTGVSEDESPTYSRRTIGNINPSLTDDDFLAVGTAVAGLQKYTLGTVIREDSAEIVEG